MIVFMSENSKVNFCFSDFCRIIQRRVDTFMLHRNVYMIVFMNENSEVGVELLVYDAKIVAW